MIRYVFLFTVLTLVACEGRLSDEQRKKMREQMDLHKIRKVTDMEITEAAYKKGREVMTHIQKGDSVTIDSIVKASEGSIHWVTPQTKNAHLLEQQLVEAYLNSEAGPTQDNIQKFRNGTVESDSILYSYPVVAKRSDGVDELKGVWNIWLSKKQLILAMPKE